MAQPEALYKYATVDCAKRILHDRTLRWVSPALMHDPWFIGYDVDLGFDHEMVTKSMLKTAVSMIFTRDIPAGNKEHPLYKAICRWRSDDRFKDETEAWEALSELLAPTPGTLEKKLKQIVSAWRDLVANARLVSFLGTPGDIQSWQHYADHYSGIVLRFEPLGSFSDPKPVGYTSQRQHLTTIREQVNDLVGIEKAEVTEQFNSKLLVNGKQFAHEKEWRCIRVFDEEDLDCGEDVEDWYVDEVFPKEALTGVYLGLNMAEANKQEMARFVNNHFPHVYVYDSKQADDQFELEFEKYAYTPEAELSQNLDQDLDQDISRKTG